MEKKIVAIIQARMNSSRFPGKVLAPLAGKNLLSWVVESVQKSKLVDISVVATGDDSSNNPVSEWCAQNDVRCFRGSESDVLSRYYSTAKEFKADIVLRITADCPLLDANVIDQVLYPVVSGEFDYSSNVSPASWPDGLDCEAFSISALEIAYKYAKKESEREHVTPYMRANRNKFKVYNLSCPYSDLEKVRWTVDSREDLDKIEALLKVTNGESNFFKLLEAEKKTTQFKAAKRNEGFDLSLAKETLKAESFAESKKLLNRALKKIPLGSQTFSKSSIQYPQEGAPFFLSHGLGGRVWDIDGNEYVDLVSALLPNVLGYCDRTVDAAIREQLERGISFSLATELEIELAELLCEMIPSAESVRFGKNGTDATSAAIRISRAYTKREKVVSCGYHGWQDWYIGATTRNKGVPASVAKLTELVPYNDLNIVEEKLKNEDVAAFILEPANVAAPHPGYLAELKLLCEKYGSVLVFDEIITGFRFANGGAQEYFGVTPHLSCFGKAMGNGMPISAVVGRADIMKEVEEIFFSGTFGGEALSLKASIATLQKIKKENVIANLWLKGEKLAKTINSFFEKYSLTESMGLPGFAPWKLLQFKDSGAVSSFALKTFFLQEMVKRGVLINNSNNICFAHSEIDLSYVAKAYDESLSMCRDFLDSKDWEKKINSPIIKPIFKVR
jgi:glutamate-1-semialdehyde aminotransferase/spore coat polysaccharide biosynthesis protein SpsF (cytidylyltransferase family)